jgi:Caspase domain
MPIVTREFLDADHDAGERNVPNGTGQDYALVIGVDHYPKFRPLRGAVADAQAFAAWLTNFEGGRVPSGNVRAIFSTPDPLTPVGDEINDAFEDILECAARTGGHRFYFYFSGHGCAGDRASDLSLCLANWSELRRRAALSSDAWLDVIVRSGAFAEVAFFMDCCRVWAVRAVGLPPQIDFARQVERDTSTRVFLAYATEFQHVAVETSFGDSARPRGEFTRALVEGLSGMAAVAATGVTAGSLKDYLETKVFSMRSQRAEIQSGFRSATRFGFATHRELENTGSLHVRHRCAISMARKDALGFEASWEWFATVAKGLNPLPPVTWSQTDMMGAPCRIVIIIQHDSSISTLVTWISRLFGWSLHGDGVNVNFNRTNMWTDARSGVSVFSARLAPGAYKLRWSDRRDFAVRLIAGFDTQIVIDDAPSYFTHSNGLRLCWVPWVKSSPPLVLVDVAKDIELRSASPDFVLKFPSSRIAQILAGAPCDDAALGLLAGYVLGCMTSADPNRIESIANQVESMIGPCADIDALRLRAALIRGSQLPVLVQSEPPVFREGLLAFVDASHIVPATIAPGSLLENACVHRFVDTPISSWPNHPHRETNDPDWLTIAVAELAIKYAEGKSITTAQAIAKDLRVPTLAVQARMHDSAAEYLAILQQDEGTTISSKQNNNSHNERVREETASVSPAQKPTENRQVELTPEEAAKIAQMRQRFFARDYAGALVLAEEILTIQPDHQGVRRIHNICVERTIPKTIVMNQRFLAHEYVEALVLANELLMTNPNDSNLRDIQETCLYYTEQATLLVPRTIVSQDALATRSLNSEARFLLDTIDGNHSIEEVTRYSRIPRIVCLAELRSLVLEGVIEIVRVRAEAVRPRRPLRGQ